MANSRAAEARHAEGATAPETSAARGKAPRASSRPARLVHAISKTRLTMAMSTSRGVLSI